MDNVFDPHNVAAVMRSCDAVGIQEIYTLKNTIPLKKRYGFKSSSSASEWLTVHAFSEVDALFDALRKKYDTILTTHLSDNAKTLHEVNFASGSIAIVFGNEKYGVSDEVREKSDGDMIIPQVGIIKSLNISVACAVTIYEAFRQKQLAGHYDQRRLSDTQFESLKTEWGFLPGDAEFPVI